MYKYLSQMWINTFEEVEQVANKSLGLIGLTTNFFQVCWLIVEWDVWEVLEYLRRVRGLLQELNSPLISLISKEDGANTMDKFRLISICNVIYKDNSKFIANYLKPIMSLVTSQEKRRYIETYFIWYHYSSWSNLFPQNE